MAKRPKLTDKQRAFIDAYLRCLNATRAAREAGYSGDDNALAVIGSRNLRNAKIRAEVDRRMEAEGLTDAEILHRLKEQATADFSDAISDDGYGFVTLSVKKLIAAGKGHLIKEYKIGKDGITLKLHDSQAALVHLAKLRGMFKDDRPQWQIEIVNLVIKGEATIQQVEEEFGSDLVADLFKSTSASRS